MLHQEKYRTKCTNNRGSSCDVYLSIVKMLSGSFTHHVVVVFIFLRRVNINSSSITIVLFVIVLLVLIDRVLVFELGIQILPFCGRVGWGSSVIFHLNDSRWISRLLLLRFLIAVFTCLPWIQKSP